MPKFDTAAALRAHQRRNYAAYFFDRKGRLERLSVNLAL